MVNRAQDWLEQAGYNLRHAQASLGLGDYAWACFVALEGLHLVHGQVAWGHSILDLLTTLPANPNVPDDLVDAGKLQGRQRATM